MANQPLTSKRTPTPAAAPAPTSTTTTTFTLNQLPVCLSCTPLVPVVPPPPVFTGRGMHPTNTDDAGGAAAATAATGERRREGALPRDGRRGAAGKNGGDRRRARGFRCVWSGVRARTGRRAKVLLFVACALACGRVGRGQERNGVRRQPVCEHPVHESFCQSMHYGSTSDTGRQG